MKLTTRIVPKPWGRTDIPARFAVPAGERIGEIWFEHPAPDAATEPLALMIKYLFTSERLSVQVHPDDAQAQAAGHPHGKEEMWIVLDAEPGATLGVGLTHAVDAATLRAAAADGSIEQLLDWRAVRAGDVIYNPAGTIHALGAGITVIEVQQAVDLTYRLYDYGRPRELHLDAGLAVARGAVHADPRDGPLPDHGGGVLVDGPLFGVAWCDGGLPLGLPGAVSGPWQVAAIDGGVTVAGELLTAGECAVVRGLDEVVIPVGVRAVLAWVPTP
jgi:mannose-6-phosphate isomerase